jgi:hypothetical protein
MAMLRRFLAGCLVVVVAAPAAPARAQQHVVDKAALEQSIKNRVAEQQNDREAIRTLLRRPEVKQIAEKAGLSLARAEAAVSTLQGEELRDLATQARQAQNDLSGGASTVVISTTTIIIVLLLVILIIAIAD